MSPSNHLDIGNRVQEGKQREATILTLLKSREPITVSGTDYTNFSPSTESEDMHQKIDAWASSEGGKRHSVSIKYRETGRDLGVALIRPYDERDFLDDWQMDTLAWDRDMMHMSHLYVCATKSHLLVCRGAQVSLIANHLLRRLYEQGGFNHQGRLGDPEQAVLQQVVDQGRGYSDGQDKLIAYIRPNLLVHYGAFRVRLDRPCPTV